MADEAVSRGGWRAKRFVLILLGLMAAALLLVWTQRKPIATNFIDRELARRGVPARYEVARIGFRTERLENVSIGDPADPDLTARWAEVDIVAGLSGVRVRAIRAGGVRLRGRLIDGVVHLGAVDKLLPPASGKPFTLPDLLVELQDAQMRLDTPNGPIGFALEGRGNLANGFDGTLAASAPALDFGGCDVTRAKALVDLSIRSRRPHVEGPVRAEKLLCPGARIAITEPRIVLDATLSEAFDAWTGDARLQAAAAVQGRDGIGGVNGRIAFDGDAERTRGTAELAAQALRIAGATATRVRIEGRYDLADAAQGMTAQLDGSASIGRMELGAATLRELASYADTGAGTPLQPIAALLANSAVRAGRAFHGSGDFTARLDSGAGALRLSGLRLESASGARVALTGGEGLAIDWPSGLTRLDGRFTLAGGGFPSAVVELTQSAPGAPMTGVARLQPITAGEARLALEPVRFTAATGGRTRFETVVALDGPLGDGRVEGLSLPVAGVLDGAGGLVVNPGCAPLAFKRLAVSGLVLNPARLRLCPTGEALLAVRDGRVSGGASLDAPRLAGRIGDTPLTLAARGARIGFTDAGFRVAGLQARLGEAGSITRLDFAELSGRFAGGGVRGAFSGGEGQIANVPLLISEGAGDWRLADGVLTLTGGLRVADAAPDPRFQPLVTNDLALRLADNRITADATLREPATGAEVTDVAIVHDLGRGVGRADLAMQGLSFNRALQPEQITRLALGVVANVVGTVTGEAHIGWSPDGVTSDGVFRTSGMDLAAAFGPVTGLSTEIRFTDLLGLVTAPGQVLTVETVNPGILVEDGRITYQLVEGQRARIEGGRWPFAGGELILEPTVIDFSADKPRRLTFRIVGLDAAIFIQRLEFDNLAATGIFDGTIPLVFDGTGGHVENGQLAARAPGGTVAYVGEVSNADLGVWGDIAFDALKSIAYENLTIELNGDIDGEMITEVRFNGVSRGTIEPVATGLIAAIGGQLASELQRLPFIFNITIRAPFRQLLNTARSFSDPSILLRDRLPPELQPEAPPTVQPNESETRP